MPSTRLQSQSSSLVQALSLSRGMTLSFVGAGGKTSLMFALAAELAASGHSVLATTTTAIFHPAQDRQPHDKLIIGDIQNLSSLSPETGQIVVAAQSHDPESNKLKGYSPGALTRVWEGSSFDYILIEADGSKRLPIKAPGDHEPVIPIWTDMVIGCIGLDCLGNALDSQTVHRPQIFSSITNTSMGDTIGSAQIISLVAADQGLFKNTSPNMQKFVFFNKADTRELVQKGHALAHRILKEYPQVKNCLVACLLDTKNPAVYFSG